MGHWTVFAHATECGCAEPHLIAAGAPVRVVTGRVMRCAAHAGVPVDDAVVDVARLAIERAQLEAVRGANPTPPTVVRVRPGGMVPLSALANVPFDAKAAAIGGDE
jgi:hypothetical protein